MSYKDGWEIERFENPEEIRDLVLEYLSTPVRMEIWKDQETPWTDGCGDTDEINLPVILIGGSPEATYCFRHKNVLQFALQNLELSTYERKDLESKLSEIETYRALFERNVGSM
ncbi:MAG: hypothetical protein OEL87_00450 [Nanoarchaeota archaeon]|nr:hypothetical protein [Nanoarchaeota archaeon]